MRGDVLDLQAIEPSQRDRVGAKAANLAKLARIGAVRVPTAFCVTTDAYDRALAGSPSIGRLLERLSQLGPEDMAELRAVCAEIRAAFEAMVLPDDLVESIDRAVARLGAEAAWAVRSSATAEDQPTASFAGQLDSWLNVVGSAAVVAHVKRCWASLYNPQAVVYRLRAAGATGALQHGDARMAVIVQRLVPAEVAGVLFTADPVTSSRRVLAIEACYGLGEALVSGTIAPDVYRVRDGRIVERVIATQTEALRAVEGGGTRRLPVEPERQDRPTLTDAQVLELAQLGRRVEAELGGPQDIEWCLDREGLHVVQSRPITTLFPIPEGPAPGDRVYVSVGHQQMMTDPMKPLGWSLFQLTAGRPMFEAGGRLCVDVTQELASPTIRPALLDALGRSDPLIGSALRQLVDRGDVVRPLAEEGAAPPSVAPPPPLEADPTLVVALIERTERSVSALERGIVTLSGPELLDFILQDIEELKRLLFDPQSHRVLQAAMEASRWLDEQMDAWLGEPNVADTLTRSVPGDVTAEMGRALMEVADVVRPHPEVVTYLQGVEGEDFLDGLAQLDGGARVRDALRSWLDRFGMRGVGEIDITRPRFRERPSAVLPLLLAHVAHFEPGEAARRFEQGWREASREEQELLTRLRALPDGHAKAEQARRQIARLRVFMGYREFPKYGISRRYFVYKQALMRELRRLVASGVLEDEEDAFFLTFEELRALVRTRRVDAALVSSRKAALRSYAALVPPRVITSDGEIVAGTYGDAAPAGALVGLAVSRGTVEGRARVILDFSQADLEPGDILVTTYTDPSWTPVFLTLGGLVTEVGGRMTHGAVVAREFGLPAVVGVEGATRLIRDGQRIRVRGAEGLVELLEA